MKKSTRHGIFSYLCLALTNLPAVCPPTSGFRQIGIDEKTVFLCQDRGNPIASEL
ncbi:MAG TPA: hypothetical protein VLA60_13980 [Nitrospirales bacterium]|nr:hypothetical protein [Nitrospirales bacterium]